MGILDDSLALRAQHRDLKAQFVLTELELGITFCRIAKNAKKGDVRFEQTMSNAWKALNTAEKYMWKLDIGQEHFDELMTKAERLRFELKNLHL